MLNTSHPGIVWPEMLTTAIHEWTEYNLVLSVLPVRADIDDKTVIVGAIVVEESGDLSFLNADGTCYKQSMSYSVAALETCSREQLSSEDRIKRNHALYEGQGH